MLINSVSTVQCFCRTTCKTGNCACSTPLNWFVYICVCTNNQVSFLRERHKERERSYEASKKSMDISNLFSKFSRGDTTMYMWFIVCTYMGRSKVGKSEGTMVSIKNSLKSGVYVCEECTPMEGAGILPCKKSRF